MSANTATFECERFLYAARGALQGGGLTPLQVQEIQRAVKAHEEGEESQATLQAQREEIEIHWERLSRTLTQHGVNKSVLKSFAYSLSGLLMEEYFNLGPHLSHVSMRDFVGIFGTAEQRQTAANILTSGREDELEDLCEKTINFAITELMINRDHVHERLRNAAAGVSYTEMLLGIGDISRVKEVIEEDQACVQQIVLFRPDLQNVQLCIDTQTRTLLAGPSFPTAAPEPQKASSFWTSLKTTFGLLGTQARVSCCIIDAAGSRAEENLAIFGFAATAKQTGGTSTCGRGNSRAFILLPRSLSPSEALRVLVTAFAECR
nr:hypothetical protein CFP56_12961 [Quercus suber]